MSAIHFLPSYFSALRKVLRGTDYNALDLLLLRLSEDLFWSLSWVLVWFFFCQPDFFMRIIWKSSEIEAIK